MESNKGVRQPWRKEGQVPGAVGIRSKGNAGGQTDHGLGFHKLLKVLLQIWTPETRAQVKPGVLAAAVDVGGWT